MILWYRRDLRVADHVALRAALAAGPFAAVFCLDDRLLHGRHASGPRTQFLLESLADLDRSLRERGSALVIRRGAPERELPALARELGAAEVHCTDDAGPFAVRRDRRVAAALGAAGVELCAHPGVCAVDDVRGEKPYTVFTPFHRAWLNAPRRAVLAAPDELPRRAVAPGALPSLAELGLAQEVEAPARGGERAARARLDAFLRDGVHDYADGRDALGREGTSRLSPYLHLGCLSVREVEARLPDGRGAAAFRRQLAWRDFHHHVLAHHPANARRALQARYRGLRWSRSEARFAAWCDGRTGFPLVDAGMRQLRREGWMHNRARLVAGSFLTKDLGIDWRRGERHFMRLLLDGDEANNNGNWQWVASVGADPQPAFRRMFNPTRQMERFDPDGAYVRRHVPELRRVPAAFLREPWTMPDDVQREAGCVIGVDYPEPIVDHAEARRAALERYRV
ncbi:MAG TPA: deoxyribodipyrimidine photo-lyase [Solirubrobacteraceae bacterium]